MENSAMKNFTFETLPIKDLLVGDIIISKPNQNPSTFDGHFGSVGLDYETLEEVTEINNSHITTKIIVSCVKYDSQDFEQYIPIPYIKNNYMRVMNKHYDIIKYIKYRLDV